MVDAPVGRTSAHAVTGTSTFMVGGDAADVERARPLLLSMGEAVAHCGPLGAGATVKLANNYISAVVNMATAESLTLGLAAGIELDKMVEVISQTPAGQGHIRTTWPQKALVDDPTPPSCSTSLTKTWASRSTPRPASGCRSPPAPRRASSTPSPRPRAAAATTGPPASSAR